MFEGEEKTVVCDAIQFYVLLAVTTDFIYV